MKNKLISCLTAILLLAMQFTQAATICDVKSNLSNARLKLVEMLNLKDRTQQEALKETVDEASTALEIAIDTMLGDIQTPEDTKTKLTQFKEIWITFKETREIELVPALYADEVAKAKELAAKTQAERLRTMNALIQELGGGKCEDHDEEHNED